MFEVLNFTPPKKKKKGAPANAARADGENLQFHQVVDDNGENSLLKNRTY